MRTEKSIWKTAGIPAIVSAFAFLLVACGSTGRQSEAIEARLGFKLLPGQRDQFQYFEMTGEKGKRLGKNWSRMKCW